MFLHEVSSNFILSDDQFSLLSEQVGGDLNKLVSANLAEPYHDGVERLQQLSVKKFAPKLKAWAMERMHDVKKGGDQNTITLIQQILNQPEVVAQQLLKKAINKAKPSDDVPTVRNDINKTEKGYTRDSENNEFEYTAIQPGELD